MGLKSVGIVLCIVGIAACTMPQARSGKSSEFREEYSGGDPEPTPIDHSTIVELPGTLDLSDAVGLAVMEFDYDLSLRLRPKFPFFAVNPGSEQNTNLAKVKSDGSIEPISVNGPADVWEHFFAVEIVPLGEQGTAVRGSLGSFRMIIVKPDGAILGINPPDNIEKAQYTEDGRLWIRAGSSLYFIDLLTREITRVTDPNQTILEFLATSWGDVFITGHLKHDPKSIGFVRRVKRDLGVETFSGDLPSLYRDDVVIGDNQITKIENDAMIYEYLPISTNLGTTKSQFISDNWLATPYAAVEIKENRPASNPLSDHAFNLKSVALDPEQGLVFEPRGNVSQIEILNHGKVHLTHHKTLRYRSSPLKVVQLFGPSSGFNPNWYGVATDFSSDETPRPSYWVEVDPTSGFVDVDGAYRITNMIHNNAFNAFRIGDGVYFIFDDAPAQLRRLDLNQGTKEATFAPATSATSMPDGCGQSFPVLHNGRVLHTCHSSGKTILYSYDLSNDSNSVVADFFNQEVNGNFLGSINRIAPTPGGQPILFVEYYVADEVTARPAMLKFNGPNFTSPSLAEIDHESMTSPTTSIVFDKNGRSLLAEKHHIGSVDYTVLSPIKADGSGLDPMIVGGANQIQDGWLRYGNGLDVKQIAPWSGSSMLISGMEGLNYRSRRVDLAARTETPVSALDGIQVYFAKKLETFFW
jgi:hypothetical protein